MRDILDQCPEVGMRAWYLSESKKVEQVLGFQTPEYLAVPWTVFTRQADVEKQFGIPFIDGASAIGKREAHPEIVDFFIQNITDVTNEIEASLQARQWDTVLVRPSALDEYTYPNLSFAGVYKSDVPNRRQLDATDQLLRGTAQMLAGRYTKYGNCYYDRHQLKTERLVGVLYMKPFFDPIHKVPLLHGTGFVMNQYIRSEYMVAPVLGETQREPRLLVRWNEDVRLSAQERSREDSVQFSERLCALLDGLQAHFREPLDVEYLFDAEGTILIVQIRRLSQRHIANWEKAGHFNEELFEHSSAIVDSVGQIEGQILDLRSTNRPMHLDEVAERILVVNHEPTNIGTSTESLLDQIRGSEVNNLRVVVDHGNSRMRDHLQYALVEDPALGFVVQTADPSFLSVLSDGQKVIISSTGVSAAVTKL